MKKATTLTTLKFIPLLSFLFPALVIGFRPPSAAAMDIQLALATEEVVREMRENGELPPDSPAGSMVSQTDIPPSENIAAIEEEEPEPFQPGFESEKLIIETEVVPAVEPKELIEETEVVPAVEPEKLIGETEVVTAAAPAAGEVPTQMLQESLDRRVTLKYVDADIRVVLRSLARAYNFNVTLAPEVQGKVTLDFTNVRIIDALETILIDQGLGYRITGDIVRVTSQEKIQQETAVAAAREAVAAQKAVAESEKRTAEEAAEPLVVKIFNLKYIDAKDAKDAIQPMVTARGKAMVLQTKQYRGFEFEATESFGAVAEEQEAAAFVRSRILIVQDIQSVLMQIEEVIDKIDHRPPQILIDAKVLEVPIDQESRLGINWTQALNGWTVGAKDLTATFDKHFGSDQQNLVGDSREWGTRDLQQRDFYDRGESQSGQGIGDLTYQGSAFPKRAENTISVPSLVDWDVSETLGGPYQENLAWRANVQNDLHSRGYDDVQSQQIFDNYLNNVASNLTTMATAGQTYSAVLNAADFNLMLSAMRTDSNIVILSNPRIIVHENYAAKIFVGERYPILETQVSGQDAAVGGTSVSEWREIGITLKVIPQVRAMASGGDSINMIIHPAVSKRTGQYAEYRDTMGRLAFSSYPIIDIREADTNVTISDGDTIVIGGLISSYTEDKVSKIPLLGDIPILGYLFKEEYSNVEKRNLLIFITARIVTEETEFSAYEKLMLEKMPAEALQDIHYTEDFRVRPYLYRNPAEAAPAAEEELTAPEEKIEAAGEEEAGNGGNFKGRVTTRAMERSRR